MTNAINVIFPDKDNRVWVFDDPSRGLLREPFVEGTDRMVDRVVADIPNAASGFKLTFSATPFPGHQYRLDWLREDGGGNWYRSEQLDMEGWLCPALLLYFPTDAPERLYVKPDQKRGTIQRLNVARVKAAARKAYKARKLAAQHPTRAMRKCNYQVGDYRCAIGAALSTRTLAEIVRLGRNDNTIIGKLWHIARLIKLDGEGERVLLSDIQEAHDRWATASKDGGAEHEHTIKRRDEFLKLIGLGK